jgi:hypothetical protein
MNKLATAPERRQFGRRYSQVHGWICVEGRPRQSCTVQNFSETGALLEISPSVKLPRHFILDIDAIKFRMGCEVTREMSGARGVKFMPAEEVAAAIAAEKVEVSTYEKLLALAEAEHDMAENTEVMRNVQRYASA